MREILSEKNEVKYFNEDGFLKILRDNQEVEGLTDDFLLDFHNDILKKFEDEFKEYTLENDHAHRLWDVLEDERELGKYRLDCHKLRKIRAVYVKPKAAYEKAEKILNEKKLLIITGQPNVGKTAMAHYLGIKTTKQHNVHRFLEVPCRGELLDIKNLKDSVILFDDIFGGADFINPIHADNFEEIEKLKEDNYVLITTRGEILDKVRGGGPKRTKFAEIGNQVNEHITEIKQEGSYSDDDLKDILRKHVSYYLRNEKITEREVQIAEENIDKITGYGGLRFPHNINFFVSEKLRKITNDEEDINDAIENAKDIKRCAGSWFCGLDKPETKKYFKFVFTVALFPGFDKKTFERIYKNIHSRYINKFVDIDELRKGTSYITSSGYIDFESTDFREGVMEKIKAKYMGDVVNDFSGLEKLAGDSYWLVQWFVVSTLKEIGKINPDDDLQILKKMAGDSYWYIRFVVAGSLGEIGKVKPADALPILKKLVIKSLLKLYLQGIKKLN